MLKIFEPSNTKTEAGKVISAETYTNFRDDIGRYENWRAGRQCIKTDEIPDDLKHVSNDMRGKVEQYEFLHNPPEKYTLYYSERAINETGSFQTWGTTWNGEILGRIHTRKEWRDNFGGKRVSFTMSGINGKSYHGTYYKSAGDYCRIKLSKKS